ncbi:SH3 domain-containing protein [Leptospira biflexa]|uniref:SH3 domain-containing protein n=2 Tax=Leptospira biflexa TaxID=172 RepID=UPI001082748F|nr:SH3 domain-containing protein [Leptospira biflexa]TGM34224.1 SH3 domain-containing protein [Leptospira biflexa]TGM40118.1 SH3 domain-containing protein [Leptospira biflexa]TGM48283.1 SH3 domain-containing protein [Leptospira biflexa]TGM49251.1 SH3 domain-containing protein [Leptospira biflexa]
MIVPIRGAPRLKTKKSNLMTTKMFRHSLVRRFQLEIMKYFLAIVILLFLIFPLVTKEKLQQRMYVSKRGVVIKEKPNSNSEDVGTLALGDFPLIVSYTGKKDKGNSSEGEWLQIEYETSGYILSSQLSDEPPLLLGTEELLDVAESNFKRFESLFTNYSTRIPRDGLDAYETETYQNLIKELEQLSQIPILRTKELNGSFRTWFLKNNKQIEKKLGLGDCTFQFEEVINANQGCTDYKISLLRGLQEKTSLSQREVVERFGDAYCITAYTHSNDTCGRSKVGYQIYKTLR